MLNDFFLCFFLNQRSSKGLSAGFSIRVDLSESLADNRKQLVCVLYFSVSHFEGFWVLRADLGPRHTQEKSFKSICWCFKFLSCFENIY